MVEYNIEKFGGNTYLSRERKLLFKIKKRKVKTIYILDEQEPSVQSVEQVRS